MALAYQDQLLRRVQQNIEPILMSVHHKVAETVNKHCAISFTSEDVVWMQSIKKVFLKFCKIHKNVLQLY